jgi:hypothetical protein
MVCCWTRYQRFDCIHHQQHLLPSHWRARCAFTVQGVHNSQTDLAEEIRLVVPDKLPSISELRHTTDSEQHAVPLPTQSDSTPLPADVSKTLPGTGTSNLTGSSDVQQQQQEVPAGTDTTEQAKAASDSSSSRLERASSSNANGDVGLGSISSGISKAASSILQPHSRAGDGSEDELTAAAATQADESDSQLDDYNG